MLPRVAARLQQHQAYLNHNGQKGDPHHSRFSRSKSRPPVFLSLLSMAKSLKFVRLLPAVSTFPPPTFFILSRLRHPSLVLRINITEKTKNMQNPAKTMRLIASLSVTLLLVPLVTSSCRNSCGNIAINYPFGIDDGCGAPQFRDMLNCTPPDLFFLTPSGSYKVQRIDYDKKNLVVYDPAMSTCSILQPHHDLILTDIQSAMIPPSSDTVFALLNCSIDSPVLNHYRNLCFNFSGHSCDELYSSCNAFRVFHLLTNTSPPCCFTGYDTVRFMSMNILDCSHYTTVINTDNLKGVGPLDWVYGIKLSYSVPDTGCGRCSLSGGTCGFDTETKALQCLCSLSTNATRQCASGDIITSDQRINHAGPWTLAAAFLLLSSVLPL